jgi:hypothetical protein
VPMDADLNRYDTFHAVTGHARMDRGAWEATYRMAWQAYYTTAHMETLMRRAAACRISVGKVLTMLMGFWGWSMVERIHPLEGGYVRRKVRADRRPGLPLEPAWRFYPAYAADLVSKHGRMALTAARFLRLRRRLKRDPDARGYTDRALTPATAADDEDLALFSATEAARAAAAKRRKAPSPVGA